MKVGARTSNGGFVLRYEVTGLDRRYLAVSLKPGGDLVFEGEDVGSGVSGFFGSGIDSYEWTHTVAAADVPRVRDALELGPGDVPRRIVEVYGGDRAHEVYARIVDAGIPVEHFTWHR